MDLLILSFIAGVLTVAAPCVLPLLPLIIGGSIAKNGKDKPKDQWLKPVIIAASLALSVITFTLLIKATTALLGVPQYVWQLISGVLVLLLGVNFVWPKFWERFSGKSGLFKKSNTLLGSAFKKEGLIGSILTGAALGPVFSSCSPTYGLIVATILPASFGKGFLYLVAYAIGMSATLLLIAYVGQTFTQKLRVLSDSIIFNRTIGLLFIIVGLSVIFGFDKAIQSYVLEQGWYDPIGNIENRLRK